MHDDSLVFLKNLLQTPSPSGFERPIQDVVREWARPHAGEVRTVSKAFWRTDGSGPALPLRRSMGSVRARIIPDTQRISSMECTS